MGFMRSACTSLVSATAGPLLEMGDGSPANTCRVIFCLAALAHASHVFLRPSCTCRVPKIDGLRIVDEGAASVPSDAMEELRQAHEAARAEVAATKAAATQKSAEDEAAEQRNGAI